jgi:hypothetical protein
MMAFDEAKFRAEAKAAGYSDAEINAELKGAVPAGAAPAPSMDDTFADKERALREEYDKKVKQATTSEVSIGDRTFEIPTFFTSPAGIVTAAAAGIGLGSTLIGAGAVAPKVYQSIKNRYMTKPPEIDRTIDIPMGGAFDTPPAPQPVAQPTPQATPDRVQQAQQLAEANRQLGIGGNQPVPPTAPVAAPVAPPEPIATPITAAPVDAPAPTPTPGPNSPVTTIVNDTVKEMIQQTPDPVAVAAPSQPVAPPQELLTGTGKPAFAGMGPEAALNKKGEPKFKPDYADINQVPRGFAFVPGAQYIDTPRQNIGQAEYTKAYTDRLFPLTNELAIQESKDINKLLGRATRAETKAAGLPPAELTPGITKKTSAGTKPVRVAGTLGALIAIPDLAKAETADQRGAALTNLLEAVMPPGFTMSSAGEGSTLTPEQMQYQQNAMLLGSPYAQTEIAKKRRQALEYAAKVGGGRGLTPASAYPR